MVVMVLQDLEQAVVVLMLLVKIHQAIARGVLGEAEYLLA
jgi:hypothetical protein